MSGKCYGFMSNIGMTLYITCWMSQYCYQVSLMDMENFNFDDYTTFLALMISGASLFLLGFVLGILRVCLKATIIFWIQLVSLTFGMTLVTIGMIFGEKSSDVFGEIGWDFNYPFCIFCGIIGIYLQSFLSCYDHAEEEPSKE